MAARHLFDLIARGVAVAEFYRHQTPGTLAPIGVSSFGYSTPATATPDTAKRRDSRPFGIKRRIDMLIARFTTKIDGARCGWSGFSRERSICPNRNPQERPFPVCCLILGLGVCAKTRTLTDQLAPAEQLEEHRLNTDFETIKLSSVVHTRG